MASEVKKTIVDTATSDLTTRAIALLLPLLLSLVSALVPPVRDRILPVLPRPLLAVLIGISLSANLALFFYVLRLRKTQRQLIEQRDTAQTFIKKFTVKWDEHSEPHCPVCLSELAPVIHPVSGIADIGFFKCISCKHGYRLTNEATGKVLTLAEAKELLTSNEPPRAIAAPLFDRAKLRQALSDLESLKKNLPNSDVKEEIVVLYHDIIDTLKDESGYDLTSFRIPLGQIRPRPKPQSRTPRISRFDPARPAQSVWSEERYCSKQIFHTAIDRAISRLNLELAPAIDQPLPTNIKLKQAIIRLESLGNLPIGDVEEKYVVDYHSILDIIQQEIGHDLTDFYIPLRELHKQITSTQRDVYGELTEVNYTDHRYCARGMFDVKYKAAKSFIMPYAP